MTGGQQIKSLALTAGAHLADLLNRAVPTSLSEWEADKIALAVHKVLAAESIPRLRRRLREESLAMDDAEDIAQLAAIRFIRAFGHGQLLPDRISGLHTAQSVVSYLWGICKKLLLRAIRTSNAKQSLELQEDDDKPVVSDADDDAGLWELLSYVRGRCRPEDILMAYLYGRAFNIHELRILFDVGINTPNNCIKRVGLQLRKILPLK